MKVTAQFRGRVYPGTHHGFAFPKGRSTTRRGERNWEAGLWRLYRRNLSK